jgi:hypothetical protein
MPDKIQIQNPLTAFFDADPGGWKPMWYPAFFDLGVAAGARARNIIRINWRPYMWVETAHTIVGNIDDPETSGLYNDGQYLVSVADERQTYVNAPSPANLLWGPHKSGEFAPMPIPVFFPADHSINVELENIYTRTLTPPADTFRVYVELRGMHYYGSLQVPTDLLDWSQGGQKVR